MGYGRYSSFEARKSAHLRMTGKLPSPYASAFSADRPAYFACAPNCCSMRSN